jgi:hypothetical protein
MEKMNAFGDDSAVSKSNDNAWYEEIIGDLYKEPMLNIWVGSSRQAIRNPDVYFNNYYEEEWFQDDLVKRMVKGVENVEIVGHKLAYDWQGDPMSPMCISGGSKTLILMYKKRDFVAAGGSMGDNCCKWLEVIGSRVPCVMTLEHCMYFGSGIADDSGLFRARFLNNGAVTKTYADYYSNVSRLHHLEKEMPNALYPSI